MIMKAKIASAIVLLFFIACSSSEQISKISKQIATYNVLESEHVGIAGETTEQYLRFRKLKEIASTEELLKLLNDTNAVVKGCASWALADRKYPNMDEIFISFVESNESIETMHGCIVSSDNLANSFYFQVLYNENRQTDSTFYAKQLYALDSLIINVYPDYDWLLLLRALENNNTNPNNYDAIRKLAFEKQNKYALEALGKYQKVEDINDFISLEDKSFKAISHFPNARFWEMLITYKGTPKTLDYFLAVSAFKDENSNEYLSSIYTQLSDKEIEYLCEALAFNYSPLYFELVCNIWKEYKTIDLTLTKQLIAQNPQKASTAFTTGLLSDRKPILLEFGYNYGTKNAILYQMLESIVNHDKSALLDVCRSSIENTTFTELSTILDYIKAYKLIELADNLLILLEQKKYPFEIFHISETLLSFQDATINQKVIQILESKKSIWNSGNWADAFAQLFKEYKIKVR